MIVFVGSIYACVEVQVRDVEPYETEVTLRSYKKARKMFLPGQVKVSWTQLAGSGDVLWPTAQVQGRYPRANSGNYDTGGWGTLVFEAQDEDEATSNWPSYVWDAWSLARDQVSR
jgi:hypothetical protein